LIELFVPQAHRVERIRSESTDDSIHFGLELAAGFRRRDGDRHYDARRLEPPQGEGGCAHAGAGRETIVHYDNRAIGHLKGRPIATVGQFAPVELPFFFSGDALNKVIGDLKTPNDFLVQDPNTARRYRTHRQLFASGDTQFSHQENVQGRLKNRGNFESYRHTAARKSQDQYTRLMGVSGKPPCQHATGIGPVTKSSTHFFSAVLWAEPS
jgi:hypothetical protein